MDRFDVYISGDGLAEIDGTTLVPEPGESVHEAVLDRLEGYARERGAAVVATVYDSPGAARFLLEVLPDGSSRVLDPDDDPRPEPAPTTAGPRSAPPHPEPATATPTPTPPATPTAPEPTPLVTPTGPEPTHLVMATGPGPTPPATVTGPEPTHLVTPTGPELTHPATVTGPEPTHLVTPTGPEPISPVTATGPDPTPPAPAVVPSTVVVPAPSPEGASAVATAVARARATAAARAEMPDPAAVAAPTVTTALPADLAERIAGVNALAADGRLDEAFAEASALRESLTDALGAEHPYAVEARAVEAYLAHLRGDHREAIVLALAVARIRCGARDGRAPAEVARAAAAWQQLDDDRAVVAHGRELLNMWAVLDRNGLLPPGYAALVGQVRRQVDDLEAYV
ncbi:tetratricopeptide repeat protein [Streptomyces sp. NPDC059618]|uniref:tetratricopeptide repeat protein n=1 Tax=Streptomyces sp. NPDC059618 TaxID=3346887 RepID=UPI0036CE9B94